MITMILLALIVLLCCGILYAHRKHQDALTTIQSELGVLKSAYERLAAKLEAKIDGGSIPK